MPKYKRSRPNGDTFPGKGRRLRDREHSVWEQVTNAAFEARRYILASSVLTQGKNNNNTKGNAAATTLQAAILIFSYSVLLVGALALANAIITILRKKAWLLEPSLEVKEAAEEAQEFIIKTSADVSAAISRVESFADTSQSDPYMAIGTLGGMGAGLYAADQRHLYRPIREYGPRRRLAFIYFAVGGFVGAAAGRAMYSLHDSYLRREAVAAIDREIVALQAENDRLVLGGRKGTESGAASAPLETTSPRTDGSGGGDVSSTKPPEDLPPSSSVIIPNYWAAISDLRLTRKRFDGTAELPKVSRPQYDEALEAIVEAHTT